MRTIQLIVRYAAAVVVAVGLAGAQNAEIRSVNATRVAPQRVPGAPIQAPAPRPGPVAEAPRSKPEIQFDASTGTVVLKLLPTDASGSLIRNIRRENFAVYDNDVRQPGASVNVEHTPVSLAVLMEWGGRYEGLNQALADQVPRAADQLLSEIGREDKIAFWTYGDQVKPLAGFSQSHESLDGLILTLRAPEFSEANFYDAVISSLQQMKTVPGRRAVILISSGIDTFSQAGYEDVLKAARDDGTPIYVVNIGPALRTEIEPGAQAGPYRRIDWKRAAGELEQIAKTSGGLIYSPGSTFDLSGVYDDMMENLKVRYVITYKSPGGAARGAARTVHVELIDAATGGPLEISGADGKTAQAHFSAQATYEPGPGSAAITARGRRGSPE